MGLEAAREVRNGRLARRTRRHAARMDHHDHQNRGVGLCSGEWSFVPAAENRESQGSACGVRQGICGSAGGAGVRERRGDDERLEAAGRRQGDFYHAARGLPSRDGDESPHSPSRAARRVLSLARYRGARPVRPERRRKGQRRHRGELAHFVLVEEGTNQGRALLLSFSAFPSRLCVMYSFCCDLQVYVAFFRSRTRLLRIRYTGNSLGGVPWKLQSFSPPCARPSENFKADSPACLPLTWAQKPSPKRFAAPAWTLNRSMKPFLAT